MTSTFHAHDTGEVIPHARWIASPDFTAARSFVTSHAPDLLGMLGLDGVEIRGQG